MSWAFFRVLYLYPYLYLYLYLPHLAGYLPTNLHTHMHTFLFQRHTNIESSHYISPIRTLLASRDMWSYINQGANRKLGPAPFNHCRFGGILTFNHQLIFLERFMYLFQFLDESVLHIKPLNPSSAPICIAG